MSNENPYESPTTAGESPVRKPSKLRGRLVELLVVIGIIGILVALLLPATRTTREPARRSQCSNNLKQIALALQTYESDYGALPPAYTVDTDGQPLHSWRTLILPYLEQQSLYEKIDLTKPWDDPVNKEAHETRLSAYQCPSVDCPPNHTTYLAVVAPGGCFQPIESRTLAEITDDTTLTLMVVEVDAERDVHWMSPSDTNEQWIMNLGTAEGLPHPGGVQAACVGGNVLFLSSTLEAETLRALISIDGDDDPVAQAAN